MWKNLIKQIIIIEKSYDGTVNSGVTQNEIDIFINEFKSKISPYFPENYFEFLKKVNGIEFNGFVLYGIDQEFLTKKYPQKISGLIDENLAWRIDEVTEGYIYLGHADISWYVFDISTGQYLELDLPSGSTETVYDTVDELINKCLSDSLL